jgi:hypothetical protein
VSVWVLVCGYLIVAVVVSDVVYAFDTSGPGRIQVAVVAGLAWPLFLALIVFCWLCRLHASRRKSR